MVVKGVDMEVFFLRDVNVQWFFWIELKIKVVVQVLKVVKDKEYLLLLFNNVVELFSLDWREGMVYEVGKVLGKGGFVICYEGVLVGFFKKFVFKIVKSQMLMKME